MLSNSQSWLQLSIKQTAFKQTELLVCFSIIECIECYLIINIFFHNQYMKYDF